MTRNLNCVWWPFKAPVPLCTARSARLRGSVVRAQCRARSIRKMSCGPTRCSSCKSCERLGRARERGPFFPCLFGDSSGRERPRSLASGSRPATVVGVHGLFQSKPSDGRGARAFAAKLGDRNALPPTSRENIDTAETHCARGPHTLAVVAHTTGQPDSALGSLRPPPGPCRAVPDAWLPLAASRLQMVRLGGGGIAPSSTSPAGRMNSAGWRLRSRVFVPARS